jgi:hypothetical protein
MRPRSLVVSLLFAAVTAPAAAQTFEAVPDTGRLTVGDPVSIRLVLRQYEGDALLEQVPRAEVRLDNGIRLLNMDSMRPIANRLLEARVRLAFYRPGPQTIPSFAIDFRRGAVILHGTMRTEPVAIAGTGKAFLVRARALLTGWREAAGPGKASDAVR